jgi:hypothetical protein
MQKFTGNLTRIGPAAGKPKHHEHVVRLDGVRQRLLIQVAQKHGLTPQELILKAIDVMCIANLR